MNKYLANGMKVQLCDFASLSNESFSPNAVLSFVDILSRETLFLGSQLGKKSPGSLVGLNTLSRNLYTTTGFFSDLVCMVDVIDEGIKSMAKSNSAELISHNVISGLNSNYLKLYKAK